MHQQPVRQHSRGYVHWHQHKEDPAEDVMLVFIIIYAWPARRGHEGIGDWSVCVGLRTRWPFGRRPSSGRWRLRMLAGGSVAAFPMMTI